MSADSLSQDTSELYYALMEADRIEAMSAYFAARPRLEAPFVTESQAENNRNLFKAGYERAYEKLWVQLRRVERLAEMAAKSVLAHMDQDDSRDNPRSRP